MLFKKVRFRNFLSFGNTWTELKLNSNNTYLVTGENGSGKTTALEAFYYGMTGKPFRKIKKEELINTFNKKELLVEIEFEHNGSEFTVRRGIKPNIFELYKDGKIVDTDASRKDYQKTLENLIGVDSDTFANTIFVSSKNYTPFLKLNASDKRNFIENILNLKLFSEMVDELKVQRGVVKEKLALIENNISNTNDKLEIAMEANTKSNNDDLNRLEKLENDCVAINKEIEDLNIKLKEQKELLLKENLEAKIEKAKNELVENDNQVKNIYNEYEKKRFDINAELIKLINEDETSKRNFDHELADKKNECKMTYTKLQTENNHYQSRINEKLDKMEFYKKNDICPTCQQPISVCNDNIKVLLKNMETDIESDKEKIELNIIQFKSLKQEYIVFENNLKIELEKKLAKNKILETEKQSAIDRLMDEKNKKIAEVAIAKKAIEISINNLNENKRFLQGKVDEIANSIKIQNMLLSKNNFTINELKNRKKVETIDTEPFKKTLERLAGEKLETETLYSDILDMVEILSDKGIKTYIIKKYIPQLNEKVNKYLEIFSAKYRIAFDENFDINIFARGYEKLSYGSFSSGEEQRLDLSLLFAFYELGKLKKSINTNVVFFDEISDKSLDADGIDGLMNIFNSLKRNGKTVYNISHRVEMQDRFDRTINVTKQMFSKLV